MSKVIMTDVSSGPHGDAGIKLTVALGLTHKLAYDIVCELRLMYNPMFTFRTVVGIAGPVGYGINIYIPNHMCGRMDIIMELGLDIQVLLNKHLANHE